MKPIPPRSLGGRSAGTVLGRVGRARLCVAVIATLCTSASAANRTPPLPEGAALYRIACEPCHGIEAHGNGPDADFFLQPPPSLRGGSIRTHTREELLARILDGASLRVHVAPQATVHRAETVEALTAHLRRLPRVEGAVWEEGAARFSQACSGCHGVFGEGLRNRDGSGAVMGRLTLDAKSERTPDQIRTAIARHREEGWVSHAGPAGAAGDRLLIGYVRTLRPGHAPYLTFCAGCHGDDGLGGMDMVGLADPPLVRFDADYFARKDPEELREKVWHMVYEKAVLMPHFRRELSEEEAGKIIDYLRSLD